MNDLADKFVNLTLTEAYALWAEMDAEELAQIEAAEAADIAASNALVA